MSTTSSAPESALPAAPQSAPGLVEAGPVGAPGDWADELTLDALEVIAEGITALAGFGVAAISLARDANHLQVMAVAGDEEARQTLLGTMTPVARLMSELADAEDWGLFRFVPAEQLDPEAESWGWVPDVPKNDAANAWDPMDLLVAPLFDPNGRLRAMVSIDLPEDGLRPDPARRALLNRYAAQAGRAVEVAVQREALTEQVRLANAAREVVRNASSELELATLIKQVQPAVISGFRARGMWIHTFDEDGHGQGAVYAEGGVLVEMPAELVRLAVEAGTESWMKQRAGIVSRTRVEGSSVSDGEIEQIVGFLEEVGIGSILFSPMGAGQECLGSMVLTRGLDDAQWTDGEIEVALDLGRDLGRAILNARAFEREREVIRELQEIDRYKSQLVATLSHELKSPLTAILANVELATLFPQLDPELRQVLEHVDRGAVRLVRVVENLLLLAQVGDPDMPLLTEPVDLRELVEDLVVLNRAESDRRDVEVVVQGGSGKQLALGDRTELDLMLQNLLSNAVKYSVDGGRVTLALTRRTNEIIVTCHDQGIGISPQDQQQLFQEFFRSSNPAANAEPGTGLGLAIVHRIVTRHHGRIEVESELGAGSTFRVHLPAAQ